MSRPKQALPGGTRVCDYITMGALSKRVPASLVHSAVIEADRQSIRRRQLPAELVALFCMCLWLYRDVSYEDVLDCLLEAWRWFGLEGSDGATKGAISQARVRLGPEPMRLLFEQVAVPLATPETKGAWYKDKRLVSIDGTLFDTPDTSENGRAFGYPGNGRDRASFPKVRVLTLLETGTHAPLACRIGSYTTSEIELCRDLLHKIEPDMLVLVDRNYFGANLWKQFEQTGASLLWRIQKNAPVDIIERLPDGSYKARLRHNGPESLLRVIVYEVQGAKDQIRLATNMMDLAQAPAIELAGLYPQRWESELAFDEIKNHLNESRLSVRSKKPELVEQEIWGLMLLHWAIRDLMHDAAIAHARDPDTISFARAVRLVKLRFTKDGSFSPSVRRKHQNTDPEGPG